MNGVGLEFNHLFGYGVLDAGAMVALSKKWKTYFSVMFYDKYFLLYPEIDNQYLHKLAHLHQSPGHLKLATGPKLHSQW